MSYIQNRSDESLEDYLEAILMLEKRIAHVRSIDIVNHLNFSKPSISIAMKKLREKELIAMDESNIITLTEAGRKRAEAVYERHTLLTELLEQLGVDPEIARNDACKIEHGLSDETFEAIKRHVKLNQR